MTVLDLDKAVRLQNVVASSQVCMQVLRSHLRSHPLRPPGSSPVLLPGCRLAAKSKNGSYMLMHGIAQLREALHVSKPERATVKIIVALIPGRDKIVVRRIGGTTENTGLQPTKVFKKRDGSSAEGFCVGQYTWIFRRKSSSAPTIPVRGAQVDPGWHLSMTGTHLTKTCE
jgi:hypothetical protein